MVIDCEDPWDALQATLQARFDDISRLIGDQMDGVIEYLGAYLLLSSAVAGFGLILKFTDTELAQAPEAAAALGRVLEARANLLLSDVEDHWGTFEAGLALVHLISILISNST